jgi:hypothetical protein
VQIVRVNLVSESSRILSPSADDGVALVGADGNILATGDVVKHGSHAQSDGATNDDDDWVGGGITQPSLLESILVQAGLHESVLSRRGSSGGLGASLGQSHAVVQKKKENSEKSNSSMIDMEKFAAIDNNLPSGGTESRVHLGGLFVQ